jgi:hypothetical protein
MNNIMPRQENGNGQGSVNGRGSLRRKLTESQRDALAVDIATGVVPFTPSFKQTAAALGTTPYRMRQERKAREVAAERERQAEYARQGALPIVRAWDHATPQGRAEAIQLIGRGEVWDVLASTL